MTTEPILNPYIRLTTTFDPKNFFGPFEALRYILETISQAHTIAPIELLALPNMGKSTLLRYIAHPEGALQGEENAHWLASSFFQKEPKRLFPVLVEFRLMPKNTHSFLYLLERFTKEYAEYKVHIQNISHLDIPDLSLPYREGFTPEEALNALRIDSTLLANHGIRPVLLLDDFDLPFKELSLSETVNLRPLRDVVALVMAIEKPLHLVNKEAAGSPLFQSTPLRRLDGLAPEEARKLAEMPAKNEETPFPRSDIDFVLEQTSGHPYLIILASGSLWDLRKKFGILSKDIALTTNQKMLLLGNLTRDFVLPFGRYWKMLEAVEQAVLKLLSENPSSSNNLNRAQSKSLSNLLDLGLVRYVFSKGTYEIFSPLFADYVLLAEDGVGNVVQKEPENLSGFEVKLLDYLRQHSDRICTYEELWRNVWNRSLHDMDLAQIRHRMQVSMSRLRQKLQTGEDIMSVRDQGYKLV